jgi:hypothetical protein
MSIDWSTFSVALISTITERLGCVGGIDQVDIKKKVQVEIGEKGDMVLY